MKQMNEFTHEQYRKAKAILAKEHRRRKRNIMDSYRKKNNIIKNRIAVIAFSLMAILGFIMIVWNRLNQLGNM